MAWLLVIRKGSKTGLKVAFLPSVDLQVSQETQAPCSMQWYSTLSPLTPSLHITNSDGPSPMLLEKV